MKRTKLVVGPYQLELLWDMVQHYLNDPTGCLPDDLLRPGVYRALDGLSNQIKKGFTRIGMDDSD